MGVGASIEGWCSGRARAAKAQLARPWMFTILAASGLCVAYLVGVIVNWGDAADRSFIANLGMLPVGLATTLLAWIASGIQTERRSRWAWRLLAMGFGSFFAGDSLFFVYQNLLGKTPFPSLADVGYLAYYPLMLGGLLAFPSAFRDRSHQAAFWLDSLTVFLGGGMVVTYFFLLPTLHAGEDSLLAYSLAVGYPVGDVLLLAGVIYLVLRSGGQRIHASHVLLSAGLLVGLAADVVYGYQSIQDMPQAGGVSDAGYMVSWVVFAWASYAEFARSGRGNHESPKEPATWPGGLLPLGSITVGLALLIYATRSSLGTETGFIILGTAALVLAVVVRQIVVLHENGRLRAIGATHDSLTGLANRALFRDRVEQALEAARREGARTAVILLDVDDFQLINHSLGPAAGDELLAQVARRLESVVPPAGTAARLGDDEFGVLIADAAGGHQASLVGRRIIGLFEQAFILDSEEVRATSSAGLVVAGGDHLGADDVLHHADQALRSAKAHGKNRLEVFE